VSGLVSFLLFVKAAVSVLAGKPEPRTGWIRGRLAIGFSHRGDRTTFFPSRVVDAGADPAGSPTIEPLPWHGSADLLATSGADGFAIFGAGDRDYVPGEIVDFLPMRSLRYPT
jgi:molybdopterin biosynthesis enzyme